MITRWYIGFTGDSDFRDRQWYDIFTRPRFRHVLAMGYDPNLHAYVVYDPTHLGTTIHMFSADDRDVDLLILHVRNHGTWLKVKPSSAPFLFGQWRLYCVPAIKHLLGFRSSALTPFGLYRDLVRAGAEHAFESESFHGENSKTKRAKTARAKCRGKAAAAVADPGTSPGRG